LSKENKTFIYFRTTYPDREKSGKQLDNFFILAKFGRRALQLDSFFILNCRRQALRKITGYISFSLAQNLAAPGDKKRLDKLNSRHA